MEEINISVSSKGSDLTISAYLSRGGEEWVLCLHGLQSNKEMFRDLLSQLYLKKYSVLAPDFIGFGKSSKPESFSYDLEDQANVCLGIILKLDMKRIHIIGHSMGAMVGTLLLSLIPEKIASFVNMEGNFVFEDCGASKEVAALTFKEFSEAGFEGLKREIAESGLPSAKNQMTWLQQIPDYAFYKSSKSIVAWSKSGKLLPIFLSSPHKKLYVYGEQNAFKAKVLNNRVATAEISKASHFMLTDNPAECLKVIGAFLEEETKRVFFRVFKTEWFEKKFGKLDKSLQKRMEKFVPQLEEKGEAVGKPLSGLPYFREKKFDGYRLYYLVYPSVSVILVVDVSDKKAQEKTIYEIIINLAQYQHYVYDVIKKK